MVPGNTFSISSPAENGATWTSKTRPVAASSRTRTREATWSTPCSGLWDWSSCCSISDPWRIFLTTDHPNGACFWRYPEIIHLLMNADLRRERVKALPPKALGRTVLADLDREYTLSEIAIITSAGPARALGLSQKGHLGVGADADVTIYNEKPDGEFLFRYPRYVIKAGEIVVEEGEIRNISNGRGFVVHPGYDRSRSRRICGRCFSSITPCRSRTTRWNWNASNGRKSVPANKRSPVA